MQNRVFIPGDILIPQNADMEKWATVACDQYSSQPDYWEGVRKFVGDAPSTLNMMLPEAYLDTVDMDKARSSINSTMEKYYNGGIFRKVENSYIYIERLLASGGIRRGLVGLLDLDKYDFSKGSIAPIKASENTVISRLPPRIKMREHALLEMPHVMVLIDDPKDTVMEPLSEKTDDMEKLYDFRLMEGGGSIKGWRVTGDNARKAEDALSALGDKKSFEEKYGVSGKSVTLVIIGDGNHSLAAAKACWDELKKNLSEAERKNHPAKYALVELTNVHEQSLKIEPIHRIVFNTEPEQLLSALLSDCPHVSIRESGDSDGYSMEYFIGEKRGYITAKGLTLGQTIGEIQTFLDRYVGKNGGAIDYIHGDAVLSSLAQQPDSFGLLMPAVEKSDLFKSVIAGGVFPKKSFSMGHADDKRYYLECRKITKD